MGFSNMTNMMLYWLVSLFISTIAAAVAATAPEPITIQLAVILPEEDKYLFSYKKCVPAINIGIKEAYRRGYLDPALIKFKIRHSDSMCNGVGAPIAAFDYKTANLSDIFFGPCCDYSLAPVARYSLVWNKPVITSGGLADDFAEKFTGVAEYASLTRVGTNFASLKEAVVRLVQINHWTKVKLIYDAGGQDDVSLGFCHIATSALRKGLNAAHVENEAFSIEKGNFFSEVNSIMTKQVASEYAGQIFYIVICYLVGKIVLLLSHYSRLNF